MEIDFQDETGKVKETHMDLIQQLLLYAGEYQSISPDAELSVTFVDNNEIKLLNKQYRGLDKPTDVLSFALEEEAEEEIKIKGADIPIALGDIIISVDKAEQQAQDYNHSYDRELGFLALHGFLHLLGYDHMNPDDEKKMFLKQEEILNGFGLSREK
ncbi:rRNA maturation RNase YbeY [Gracilibacillus caseinilyticus]|uniref:Endoribonuclease YbeY n=1 Tax=Gracilibacillus caseinilyticus TaxID=2932256 RepID=A0ABY4ESU0_9BACI|nr:rRNA maturation RNase YbeY [Gracilibacillus caseinilyticus]UOQ47415.1 rRNA maturation RNase YbeY [Gracilibacillus caseinilyticus]